LGPTYQCQIKEKEPEGNQTDSKHSDGEIWQLKIRVMDRAEIPEQAVAFPLNKGWRKKKSLLCFKGWRTKSVLQRFCLISLLVGMATG
jgi:hypothetical protein